MVSQPLVNCKCCAANVDEDDNGIAFGKKKKNRTIKLL